MKLCDGFGCGGLDGIGNRDDTGSHSVDGDEHCRLSFRLQRRRLGFDTFQVRDVTVLKKFKFADSDFPTTNFPDDSAASDGIKICDRMQLHVAIFRSANHRGGERMFAVLFHRRGREQ